MNSGGATRPGGVRHPSCRGEEERERECVCRTSGDRLLFQHLIPRCAKSRGGQSASDAPLSVLKKRESVCVCVCVCLCGCVTVTEQRKPHLNATDVVSLEHGYFSGASREDQHLRPGHSHSLVSPLMWNFCQTGMFCRCFTSGFGSSLGRICGRIMELGQKPLFHQSFGGKRQRCIHSTKRAEAP